MLPAISEGERMSNIKKYQPIATLLDNYDGASMFESYHGEYVHISDYNAKCEELAKVKAENESLRQTIHEIQTYRRDIPS